MARRQALKLINSELAAVLAKTFAIALRDEADAYSVEEFCRRHRISVAQFYKHQHLMPASFFVASRRLISREAAAKWRAEREAAAEAESTP